MKKFTVLFLAAALLLYSCANSGEDTKNNKDSTTTTTTAVDKMEPAPRKVVDTATMQKNWMAYMTPGEVHKMMASWNGNWSGDMVMWHGPGGPGDSSKLSTVNKMILGGRYQVSTTTGNMMGMPFEGISTMAYDNARKVFINTWIDNLGSGLMTLEGTWDDATKTITLKGKGVDPGAGDGSMSDMRQTFKVVDENNHFMEMFGPHTEGKEYKIMEIKFSRKK